MEEKKENKERRKDQRGGKVQREKRGDFFILCEAKVYRGGSFLKRRRVRKMEERKRE